MSGPGRPGPRFRLLAITPPTGPVPADMPERWLAAGAAAVDLAVLLREPGRAARELLAGDGRLAPLRRRCHARGIPTLLSLAPDELHDLPELADIAGLHLRGDPDPEALARLTDIAGLHLRGDPDPEALTRLTAPAPGLRDRPLLRGRSCHGAPRGEHTRVDYTLFAPVFAPTTAQPGRPLGSKIPAGLAALRAWADEPGAVIFALGGVTPQTAAACLAAGARGLAGIGVFFGEPSRVEQDVAALRELVAARDRHVEPVSPR